MRSSGVGSGWMSTRTRQLKRTPAPKLLLPRTGDAHPLLPIDNASTLVLRPEGLLSMKRTLLLTLLTACVVIAPAAAEESPAAEAREAKGRVASLSATSITVRSEHEEELTCQIAPGRSPSLENMEEGRSVQIVCRRHEGTFFLFKIRPLEQEHQTKKEQSKREHETKKEREKEEHSKKTDDGKEHGENPAHGRAFTLRGTIATLTDRAVGVRGENRSLRCLVAPRQRSTVTSFSVGDRVQILCLRARNRVVLAKIRALEGPKQEHASGAQLKVRGIVVSLSEEAIVVRSEGESVRCRLPEGRTQAILDEYMIGDSVAVVCRKTDGRPILERIDLLDEPLDGQIEESEEEE